jgi:hypothetical protein
MLLQLGTVPNLVISSPHAAQAVLRTHDHVFASRPTPKVLHNFLYGSSTMAFGPYCEHWRKVRKLVTTRLFTDKKVNSFRHARQEEVTTLGSCLVGHEREYTNCYFCYHYYMYSRG